MKMDIARSFFILTILGIGVSSCSVDQQYQPPELEITDQWHSDSAGMEEESPDDFIWWESLNDSVLNSLMERAASSNLDLYIALTRILESRVEQKGGLAFLYPRLDGSAAIGYASYPQKTVNRFLGTKNHDHKQRHLGFFEVGFDAEWELDFFGMRAHELAALQARAEATEEEFRNMWVSLSSEVARNYISLRGYQAHLAVMDKNIKGQKEQLVLTQDLAKTGFVSSIDQVQAASQLSLLEAQRPQIALARDKAIYRLSILLGQEPGALVEELGACAALPCLPCYKPIGVPSELLRRRPDIRKAERELAAATESIASAVAALFPRISLNGFLGDIGALCSGGGATGFIGPQLLLPIFNSRLLEQDVSLNKIKAQQALYEYQKVVLEALEEVEIAIASFHSELERNQHLSQGRTSNQEAYDLTFQLYEKGFKNYLEVLVVNRTLLEAEEAYQQSQVDLLYHYIALYKALGGGCMSNLSSSG